MATRQQTTRFELKDGRRLCWYACVFNVETTIRSEGEPYTEVIKPGAFSKSLASDTNVIANIDHDDKRAFANSADGSLLLQEDEHGLFCSCWLPDTAIGNEILRRYLAGEVLGASFRVDKPFTHPGANGRAERTQLGLVDVCITPTPAYPQTKGEVQIRSDRTLNINIARARFAFSKNKAS